MALEQLAADLHVRRGLVNVYFLETQDGLALLDTGFPGSAGKILEALTQLGKRPSDLRHILLTHAHPDHIGSAAAVKRATGATVWAHPVDAPIIASGKGFRDTNPCPGLRNRILYTLLRKRILEVEPTPVDKLLQDGDSLPFAPDLKVIHVPGHCAGQIAFHWARHGGILFPADACVRRGSMKLPFSAESLEGARADVRKLAGETFDKVCFMHGAPITTGGGAAFRRTWLAEVPPKGH